LKDLRVFENVSDDRILILLKKFISTISFTVHYVHVIAGK